MCSLQEDGCRHNKHNSKEDGPCICQYAIYEPKQQIRFYSFFMDVSPYKPDKTVVYCHLYRIAINTKTLLSRHERG